MVLAALGVTVLEKEPEMESSTERSCIHTGKSETHLQDDQTTQNYNLTFKLPHLSYNLYWTLTSCRQFPSPTSLQRAEASQRIWMQLKERAPKTCH